MGAKKVGVAKDWWRTEDVGADLFRASRSKIEVIRSEDLPELITIREAAEFYKCHPKTVQKWIDQKLHGSLKIRGRRFVTPQHIHHFVDKQPKKNG